MEFTGTSGNAMRALEQLSCEIREIHETTQSWQKAAEPYGINKAMARLLAMGYNPGKKIRHKLNLPEMAQVVAMEGEIPDGAQVIKASLCECGQYFISNHPRRKRCFICSPFRGSPTAALASASPARRG
jgi:hypothetical protein